MGQSWVTCTSYTVLLTFKCLPVFINEVVMASKHNLLFLLEIRDNKRLIHTYYNFSISPRHFDSFGKIDPDWFFCSVTQPGKISLKSVQFCVWNFFCHPGFCARHAEWRYCSSYNFHKNFENPLRDISCEDYRPWISRSHPSSQPSLHTLESVFKKVSFLVTKNTVLVWSEGLSRK